MKNEIPLGAAAETPDEILSEEFLVPLKLSHRELARRMGVRPMRINEIVRGKRAISADTAIRLAKVLGTSPRFWMNLQTTHDLALAILPNAKQPDQTQTAHAVPLRQPRINILRDEAIIRQVRVCFGNPINFTSLPGTELLPGVKAPGARQ
jgi:antitoxin HigA-1